MMTLKQVDVDVDENEEEADHQGTDIKPFPSSFPHHLFSLPAFLRTEVPLSF